MFINLSEFDYVKTISKTGILTTDVCNLLEVNNKKNTKEHVLNVAETNIKLADKFKLNSEKCFNSAILHDVSAIIKPEDMIKIAKNINLELDISEKKFPFLLHQRISKLLAVDYFNITDKDILSSIECHSTLKSGPSKYEMSLFLADKISWDKEGKPPYYDIIMSSLDNSLEFACKNYIDYLYTNNKLLWPHRWMDETHRYFK